MRLSEAILLGRHLVTPQEGDLSGCALGMGMAASGVPTRTYSFSYPQQNYNGLEALWPWLKKDAGRCPCCGLVRLFGVGSWTYLGLVAHVFDGHVMGDKTWTLEQLVDYVRSIEPPDAPELPGLTRQEPCAATMTDKLIQK